MAVIDCDVDADSNDEITEIVTTEGLDVGPDSVGAAGQQVTAQVAVVQAQSPNDVGPHYITVTGNFPNTPLHTFVKQGPIVSQLKNNLRSSIQ